MKSSRGFLAAAMLAAVSLAGPPAAVAVPKATLSAPRPSRKLEQMRRQASTFDRASTSRRRGPGWTQAQVQRMAEKRRNRARNRRAHRG